MGWKKIVESVWVWKIVPLVAILGFRVWGQWSRNGTGGIEYWEMGLLVGGWILGWMLPVLEKQPKMAKYFQGGAGSAVENVLTASALSILGLWLVSSSSSFLAIGLVVGLSVSLYHRLFVDNVDKWFWVFARSFSATEKRVFVILWGVTLFFEIFISARR